MTDRGLQHNCETKSEKVQEYTYGIVSYAPARRQREIRCVLQYLKDTVTKRLNYCDKHTSEFLYFLLSHFNLFPKINNECLQALFLLVRVVNVRRSYLGPLEPSKLGRIVRRESETHSLS